MPLQLERLTRDDNFVPSASHVNFSEEMFANAAAQIRVQIVDQVGGDHVMNIISQDDCLACLDAMAIHAREGLEHLAAISQTETNRATKFC